MRSRPHIRDNRQPFTKIRKRYVSSRQVRVSDKQKRSYLRPPPKNSLWNQLPSPWLQKLLQCRAETLIRTELLWVATVALKIQAGSITCVPFTTNTRIPTASNVSPANTNPPCFLVSSLARSSTNIVCVYWASTTHRPIRRMSTSAPSKHGITHRSLDQEGTVGALSFHKLFSLLSTSFFQSCLLNVRTMAPDQVIFAMSAT